MLKAIWLHLAFSCTIFAAGVVIFVIVALVAYVLIASMDEELLVKVRL